MSSIDRGPGIYSRRQFLKLSGAALFTAGCGNSHSEPAPATPTADPIATACASPAKGGIFPGSAESGVNYLKNENSLQPINANTTPQGPAINCNNMPQVAIRNLPTKEGYTPSPSPITPSATFPATRPSTAQEQNREKFTDNPGVPVAFGLIGTAAATLGVALIALRRGNSVTQEPEVHQSEHPNPQSRVNNPEVAIPPTHDQDPPTSELDEGVTQNLPSTADRNEEIFWEELPETLRELRKIANR